ncbi:MAG: hypothetical protein Q8754_02645, partial [Sweet potato little leaf phytoplasma]|nr:hypothetical protein [Sweet potato little leaf phytoplasma]
MSRIQYDLFSTKLTSTTTAPTALACAPSGFPDLMVIYELLSIVGRKCQKERIMSELSEYNLIPKEWGGDTFYIEISALKTKGID